MSRGLHFSEDDAKILLAQIAKQGPGKIILLPPPMSITLPKGPNKTETEYMQRLMVEFPQSSIRYEAITFRLMNGHKYTPDWIVIHHNQVLIVEVKARGKDGFRHASYGRARLAFDQARIEYPMFTFRWCEKHKGEWNDGTV